MGFRVRIAALLAALVTLNAAFVAVILWAYGVFLPTVIAAILLPVGLEQVVADLLRLPVSLPGYLLTVVVFLAAQVYYGYHRVLGGTRGVEGEEEHAVAEVVGRLAMTADLPTPSVRVVDDERPSCYTVGRLTDATIVVTTGLVSRLDAAELEAVLAHELAHVKNRDVTLMTITTMFLEIAARAYEQAGVARRAVTGGEDLSARDSLALTWFLPLTVLTAVFVAPLLAVFPLLAGRATRGLAHAREYAADEAAARITGWPLALATALVALSEDAPTPTTDLRETGMRALSILPAEPVTGPHTATLPAIEEGTDVDDRTDRLTTWLGTTTPTTDGRNDASTHPPVAARVRRLQDLAAELEGVS